MTVLKEIDENNWLQAAELKVDLEGVEPGVPDGKVC